MIDDLGDAAIEDDCTRYDALAVEELEAAGFTVEVVDYGQCFVASSCNEYELDFGELALAEKALERAMARLCK